jgi:glycosyltransferase involved in cell wall biosynthesis
MLPAVNTNNGRMSERVLALIPAFNEADHISDVVTRTRQQVHEVVVIDDGSSDATAALAGQAGATVLRHDQNKGKGAAILTALDFFRQSGAEYALFLDADSQHDPAEIPKFLEAARATGAGMVVGTRMQHPTGMPWLRRLANWFTSAITSRLARQPVPDSQCGYRLIGRGVLGDFQLATAHFETETEMLIQTGRAGHRIVSVPIATIYEHGRHSHIRPGRDTVRFLKLVRKYWR